MTKVNYPSDFSAVHISSLPPHTTTTELVHLLARLGFTVPPECICIMKKPDDLRSSANVRVEDPLFAKRLCDLLYMSENPKAVQIYAPIPQASSRWRVDSNKVQVSWHKPSKVAYLNFGAREVAFQVASNFRDGKYRVFSQGVQCGMPERSGGGEDRISWTVVLSDIPLEAEERDIKKNIPFILAPRHIEMGDTSYQTSLRKANLSIERLLLRSGKMDWWQESEERYRKKRFKAMARFTSEADARHAVRSLNNTPLSFHENGKLTVQLVHSTRLKIKDSVYEAVKDEINRQKKVWNDLHMVYTVYPPVQTFRTLKIEGQTSKDIADANATLEKILSGKVAMDEDKVLWTPLFATNSLAYRKLRGLESDLDIVIVRDKLKCQVRLLGPRPECEAARLALIDIIKADSSVTSTFSIELDAQLLTQAFWGGYRAITSAIGDGKVIVDIVSRPGRLIVVGSEAEYNAARKILESHETEGKDLVGDCAICWTKAEKPVHTFCGHVYCAECLENLCFAAASSDTGIICQGDAGECNKLLALKELQVHLQSFTLEEVLETTFKTYVARHPNDLQYCPTPDCGETYRVSTKEENEYDATVINDSLFFKCQKCIETVCTVCRVSHDGMSCADWREHSSGGYEALEEAKKKLGIKNCPRCQTMLEKSFGCNHMTCPACGAHICWVCLETFSSDMPVYNHMEAKHEGIGVEYFPDLV